MRDDDVDAELAAEIALEEADSLRKAEPPPVLARDDFLAWRSPHKVSGNPTPKDNPLWHWLVRTRWSAYSANKTFDGPSPFEVGPMWCFDRFGMSDTELAGGRMVHIGGEHEDFYDPDFYIYNDVIIVEPSGPITIYGYPREVFPPKDFHTATLVGNAIVMIGGLGNPAQRVAGTTPVFQHSLDTMESNALTRRARRLAGFTDMQPHSRKAVAALLCVAAKPGAGAIWRCTRTSIYGRSIWPVGAGHN